MESTERSSLREYGTLDDDEKIRAILGAVLEPISKEYALQLSGINYQGMEDEQRAKVDAVFTQEGLETTEEDGITKYRLSDEEREKLGKSVDMESAENAIADKLMDEFRRDSKRI